MNATTERALYAFACTVALVLALVAVADVALQGRAEARQGLRTEAAVCALRAYYEGQVQQSEAFLALTLPERVKQYGAIGSIPDQAIRQGLAKERQIVRTLAPLNCPTVH
jgi:hypothetical protein